MSLYFVFRFWIVRDKFLIIYQRLGVDGAGDNISGDDGAVGSGRVDGQVSKCC
jgi:hypothetical protein